MNIYSKISKFLKEQEYNNELQFYFYQFLEKNSNLIKKEKTSIFKIIFNSRFCFISPLQFQKLLRISYIWSLLNNKEVSLHEKELIELLTNLNTNIIDHNLIETLQDCNLLITEGIYNSVLENLQYYSSTNIVTGLSWNFYTFYHLMKKYSGNYQLSESNLIYLKKSLSDA